MNLRRHKPSDLQSDAFDHFATSPGQITGISVYQITRKAHTKNYTTLFQYFPDLCGAIRIHSPVSSRVFLKVLGFYLNGIDGFAADIYVIRF